MTEDELVLGSDGLPVRVVQPWARDKLHYLNGYIEIFTTAMKDKWPRRVYIDLFAGPGRSRIEGGQEEILGSPLIALGARYPFTQLYFNDASAAATAALSSRVVAALRPRVTIETLDCNQAATHARQLLFSGANRSSTLGLAFIDPTAFQIGYDAIQRLTTGLRIDVIITVMTGYMKRFIARPSFQNPMDSFFGSSDWRQFVDARARGETITSRRLLDYYEGRLRQLDYQYFDDRVRIVNSRDRTIYHLVLASKHELAPQFSSEIRRKGRTGQIQMDI